MIGLFLFVSIVIHCAFIESGVAQPGVRQVDIKIGHQFCDVPRGTPTEHQQADFCALNWVEVCFI